MVDLVPVALGDRSYEIHIGEGLLTQAAEHITPLAKGRVFVLYDQVLEAHHLPKLLKGLDALTLAIPSGEASKSWAEFQRCTEWLLENRINRSDLVVAFGGGVIGDLVGFVAASVLRGVKLVQIPTTLLSQVDSSVGGKTAIN